MAQKVLTNRVVSAEFRFNDSDPISSVLKVTYHTTEISGDVYENKLYLSVPFENQIHGACMNHDTNGWKYNIGFRKVDFSSKCIHKNCERNDS